MRLMLLREGDAAEDLQRAVRDLARGAGHVGLGDAAVCWASSTSSSSAAAAYSTVDQALTLAHVHVGQEVAQRLVAADRAAELAALAA